MLNNSHIKFVILDINFRLTCGKSNMHVNTVNCQIILSTNENKYVTTNVFGKLEHDANLLSFEDDKA